MANRPAKIQSRSHRAPVLLSASIEAGGLTIPVKIRNVSERGALVEGERLPSVDENVFFERNSLRIKSRVAWVEGRFAGIAFARALKPDEVLRNVPQPKPRNQAEFRRPGFTSRPLTDAERRMLETWMTTSPIGPLGD